MSFFLSWVGLEYLHLHLQTGFPLLTLDNILTKNPLLIQWYEFTGVLGGSSWILLTNIVLYLLYVYKSDSKRAFILPLAVFTLFIPISLSLYLNSNFEVGTTKLVNVTTLKSDYDCKREKYSKDQKSLYDNYLSSLDSSVNELTDIILLPETALPNLGYINQLSKNNYVLKSIDFLKVKAPNAQLILGAVTKEFSPIHIKYKNPDGNYNSTFGRYFNLYNSIIAIDTSGVVGIRHKEKLVPFNEIIPYSSYLGSIRKAFDVLNPFSFAINKEGDKLFENKKINIHTIPIICYESLFGEFFSSFIKNGGNIITVIYNEGWYNHEEGRKWFLYTSSARAIETRRAVIRSSNCGYISLTNDKGYIKTAQLSEGSFSVQAKLSDKITFYTKYGDYLGRSALIILFFQILFINNKNFNYG